MKKIWIILMLCAGIVSGASAQDSYTLSYGESLLSEFTADVSLVTAEFEGNAGDVIYVSALNNIVPVEITLLSPTGGQLAFVEDAYLDNIELGSDGRYTIEFVRPEWSDDAGEFVAHLGQYAIENMTAADDNSLIYSDLMTDAGAVQVIEFDMSAGDMVTMTVFGATIGFEIFAPDGDSLLFEGIYNDPSIPLYRFPATGTYRLNLITAEPGGTQVDVLFYRHDVIPVTTNEAMTGQVEEGLPTVFAFDAVAGKMWDFNATLPEDGDKFMAIYQFDDRPLWQTQIYADQGSGPNGQPRIRPFIPQMDDTYYIALWYDDWNTEYERYDYELMVNPSTVLSLPNNSPIIGDVTPDSGVAQYAYTGKAGDRIRVTFRKTSESGELALTVLSSEDEVLTFMGRNSTVSSFDITLPLDGTYEFVIRNASYDTSTTLGFEIMVEPVNN